MGLSDLLEVKTSRNHNLTHLSYLDYPREFIHIYLYLYINISFTSLCVFWCSTIFPSVCFLRLSTKPLKFQQHIDTTIPQVWKIVGPFEIVVQGSRETGSQANG